MKGAYVICILLACIAALVLGGPSSSNGRNGYPRTNRGFKSAQLSTARGFGKRGQISPYLNLNDGGAFDNSRAAYPNSWLIEELQNNPELGRRLEGGEGEGDLSDSLFRKSFAN